MHLPRVRNTLLFALASAILFLAGCDDPSNVGLGALDDVANPPQRLQIEPIDTKIDQSFNDVTGGTSGEVSGPFLFGHVQERGPLAGISFQSRAFIDFLGTNGASSEFRDGPITYVELRLFREYTYGDTNSTVNIELYDVPEEWSSSNAPYDSTFTVGSRILEQSFDSVTDSIYSIPLPSSWYSSRSSDLRATATTFNDGIHGFQLRADAAEAILGMDETRSTLRVVSGQDTVDYFIGSTRFHSEITRTGTPPSVNNLETLFDNTGDAMELQFEFVDPILQNAALSRSRLVVLADTLTLADEGTFVRPQGEQLSLYGETAAGQQVALATAFRDDDSNFVFSGQVLTLFLQDELVGTTDFVRYFVAPARTGANSLNIYLLAGKASIPKPSLTLTLIPTN